MNEKHGQSKRSCSKWSSAVGFTLVELLVVIGIIALLISVLLPVLGKARNSANTAKCLANLKTMGQAMQLYANQYKGAILGSGATSSRCLYVKDTYTQNPGLSATFVFPDMPIEAYDFITPMARSMNLKLSKASLTKPLDRFLEQADNKYFQCPSAVGSTVVAYPSGSGPDIETIGYNTATAFLLTSGNPTAGDTGYTRISTGPDWPIYPSGYFPNIAKVRFAAKKIFAADGAKYTYQGSAQEYEIIPFPTSSASTGNHSKYSDWGAWSKTLSGSYDKSYYKTTGVDGRIASYRHGAKGGHRDGTFKMNVVYFDGHAETMDDLAAEDPSLWLPSGTTFKNGIGKMDAATAAKWGVNATTYVVP